MKKIGSIVLGIACMAALGGCQSQAASETAEYIGIEAAKEAAVKSAGIAGDQADFSTAGLDNRNGTFFYQVNFTADGTEYEYAIDAVTGVVIEESMGAGGETAENGTEISGEEAGTEDSGNAAEQNGETAAAEANGAAVAEREEGTTDPTAGTESSAAGGQDSGAGQNSASAQSTGSGQNGASDSGMIGEEKAKELALSHAGLTEEQVRYLKVRRDYDDGRSIYEVEFYGEGTDEYDYEINAITGEIIAFDSDLYDNGTVASSESQSPVSEEEVRATVLERVPGASEENLFIRLERDDGRLEYEGELIYDNMEYEFKVDAYSGTVIEWEAEQIRR
ncbi:MAG TPA: PepSY domain-containing protein [Candidatus Copromonas faecavium]|uniref:PepSY domain-containing protein n=1 Tax=Candidatus Copromonas faecavium (nom. illeg.) TaxID=2840740 RepID=A0A9D1D5K8_9FIRM|nr:PepSY domain-containing protein [Candidatus Copromonas faecavium]